MVEKVHMEIVGTLHCSSGLLTPSADPIGLCEPMSCGTRVFLDKKRGRKREEITRDKNINRLDLRRGKLPTTQRDKARCRVCALDREGVKVVCVFVYVSISGCACTRDPRDTAEKSGGIS